MNGLDRKGRQPFPYSILAGKDQPALAPVEVRYVCRKLSDMYIESYYKEGIVGSPTPKKVSQPSEMLDSPLDSTSISDTLYSHLLRVHSLKTRRLSGVRPSRMPALMSTSHGA